jgi:hypothetical protein
MIVAEVGRSSRCLVRTWPIFRRQIGPYTESWPNNTEYRSIHSGIVELLCMKMMRRDSNQDRCEMYR